MDGDKVKKGYKLHSNFEREIKIPEAEASKTAQHDGGRIEVETLDSIHMAVSEVMTTS